MFIKDFSKEKSVAQAASVIESWSTKLSKVKRHYEIVFILSPSIDSAKSEALLSKIDKVGTDNGAEFLRKDNWGKMKMAHEIQKHQTGSYFYYRLIASREAINELERAMKLDTAFLRYQTIRLSDDLTEAQIQDLVERAPKEASVAPNARAEDESSDFH